MLNYLINFILVFMFYFFRIFPIKNNKIIICNFLGKGFGDNGKYIVNELIQRNKNYDIVWLIRNPNDINDEFPAEVRTVKYNSIKSVFEQVTAGIWIDNRRKPAYVRKRRNQYYINTWHAIYGLKRVEMDALEVLTPYYINSAKRDSKMVDIFLAASDADYNLRRDAFWYEGEIARIGFPRLDILYSNDLDFKNRIKRKLGLLSFDKIVLYVPTFRTVEGKINLDIFNFDWNETRAALETRFGGNWIVLLRLHPNISKYSSLLNYSDSIKDVTNYSDIQELLLVADAVITDYSSAIFDYGVTGKPGFLYAVDYTDYISTRGSYLPLESLPFPLSKSIEELNETILSFDTNKYSINLNELYQNRLGLYPEHNSSKKVCDIIDNYIFS